MPVRVRCNFEINLSDGGSVNGRDFMLDLVADSIDDAKIAACLAAVMRLPGISAVRVLDKQIIAGEQRLEREHDAHTPARFVDLSHTIEHGLVTYKGLPAPIICDYLSREASRAIYSLGTEFQIGKIEMVTNTGTYLDCPFHRFADGKDLSQVQIAAMTDLDAVVVRIDRTTAAIDADAFSGIPVRDRAVLVHTGWDRYWNTTAYYEGHPYLTAAAARFLRDRGARLVGIDSHNIDNTADAVDANTEQGKSRPVHTTLLGAEILIVEHLCNLAALPDCGFTFSATPPKFKGAGTFPVRALAKLDARR